MTRTIKVLAVLALFCGMFFAMSGQAKADGPFIPVPIPVPVPLFGNPFPGGPQHGPHWGPPPPPPRRYYPHRPYRRHPDRVQSWPPRHGHGPGHHRPRHHGPSGPPGYPPGW